MLVMLVILLTIYLILKIEKGATGDDTNIDLKLTPKGTGKLNLDGIKFPNTDGSAGQVLQTNGSGVLSFANSGIIMADFWYTETDQTLSADTVTVITGSWSRTPKTAMGNIGSNMSESSGVFTFPINGIYLILFNCEMSSTNTNNYRVAQSNIQSTVNNSTYVNRTTGNSNFGAETASTLTGVNPSYIIDITDTTNQKVRFTAFFTSNTGSINGDLTEDIRTSVKFIRLGDT